MAFMLLLSVSFVASILAPSSSLFSILSPHFYSLLWSCFQHGVSASIYADIIFSANCHQNFSCLSIYNSGGRSDESTGSSGAREFPEGSKVGGGGGNTKRTTFWMRDLATGD